MRRTEEPVIPQSRSFPADALGVLTGLRNALAEVIAAIPEPVAGGADLQRAVNIDRNLGWKVFKVAHSTDPAAVGPYVPSRANLRTFLRAAGKRGVPKPLIESAAHAATDFERLVKLHAGDRATFDSMVSALANDESAEQMDLVHRRLVFRGQRHILGVQAKTKLELCVLQANQDDPTQVDGARVQGFVGLRRLRADVPLVVSYSGARDDKGSAMHIRREPLERVSDSCGMALLRQFCSEPLPELRAVEIGQGFVQGELVMSGVGKRAAVTCIEGHVNRQAFPCVRTEAHHKIRTIVNLRTPCEALVFDLLLNVDTFGSVKPVASVHAQHMGEPFWDMILREQNCLPGSPKVEYLGRGPCVLHTPDVPRYAEMGRYIFDRLGWNGEQFDVYRCRIEYPFMPSSVAMRFELPETREK